MSRMLSIEEFEYQTLLGSTNDAFVWGMGEVQWKPNFLLSPTPNVSESPFDNCYPSESLYMHPVSEMTINENTSGYKEAMEAQIKSLLTDGKSYWNILGDGTIRNLPRNSDISVQIDEFDKVHITVKTHSGFATTSTSLEIILEILKYTTPSQSDVILPRPDIGDGMVIEKGVDLRYYSEQARKISGYLNAVQAPLGEAFKRMTLYNPIINARSNYPVEIGWHLPFKKWLGKFQGFGTGFKMEFPKPVIKWGRLILKPLGKVFGGLAVGFGIWDIIKNGPNISNVLHTTMAIMTVIPIPVCQVIGGCYFLINGLIELSTDKDIGTHVNDILEKHVVPLGDGFIQYSF